MSKYLSQNQKAVFWLTLVDELSPKKRRKLLSLCEPRLLLENFRELQEDIIRVTGETIFDRLRELLPALNSEEEKLYSLGLSFVCDFDKDYPSKLKDIPENPIALFVAGDVSLLESRSIAVVGSRSPSRYAVKVAEKFSEAFCDENVTIVSGLARGIDSVAHGVAVARNKPTVAVVGSGLNIVYPAENRSLFNSIIRGGGAVVSEYPLDTKPLSYHFPERNRIVSGLSDAVFLAEAGIRSGALNTVSHAIEQGRDFFTVPSPLFDKHGEGSNSLLRDIPHSLVIEPQDVLSALGISASPVGKAQIQLDFQGQLVVNLLEKHGETHFEQLLQMTELPLAELNAVLFNLEMCDLVDKLPGNYYNLH